MSMIMILIGAALVVVIVAIACVLFFVGRSDRE